MTEHDWGPPERTVLEEPVRLGEVLDAIMNHQTVATVTGLPPRELWCIDHDTTESKCRDKHVRTTPPQGWKTWKDEQ